MKAKVTKDQKSLIRNALTEVLDPELHLSIVELGLVYNIDTKNAKKPHVTMTLTTMGCPLFPVIEQDIHNKLYEIGYSDVKISLTFDPPWSLERMSESAKAKLGIA